METRQVDAEPAAAKEISDGPCDYDDCENDADYRVVLDTDGITMDTCRQCSQENRIWVEANELLEGDFEAWT